MASYKSDKECVACNFYAEEMCCLHHLTSRGSGGSDMPYNLISTCLPCHVKYHQMGLVWMADKYLSVQIWLIDNEWVFDSFYGKWRHSKD